MLKIFGRILVILLLSGLIAGGLYLIVQHNPSALGIGDRPAGFEGRLHRNFDKTNNGAALPQTFTQDTSRPAHFRAGDGDFEGGASLGHGLLGITRSLIVFSVITLLVVCIQKAFALVNRRRTVKVG